MTHEDEHESGFLRGFAVGYCTGIFVAIACVSVLARYVFP